VEGGEPGLFLVHYKSLFLDHDPGSIFRIIFRKILFLVQCLVILRLFLDVYMYILHLLLDLFLVQYVLLDALYIVS